MGDCDMGVKPIVHWGKKTAKLPAEQISNCVVDTMAFRCIVMDTVLEMKGFHVTYRPGDVLRSITGGQFHRMK